MDQMSIKVNIQVANRVKGGVYIKVTYRDLIAKCLQLLGMHYLTGSDNTPYL